jgi:AraC-like DNA-binding protein
MTLAASCPIADRPIQGRPLFVGLATDYDSRDAVDRAQNPWAAVRALRIDLYWAPDRSQQFNLGLLDLWTLLASDETWLRSNAQGDRLTTAMELVLQQMLGCGFEGAMRQLYLESKAVELLALWLEQVQTRATPAADLPAQPPAPPALKDGDRDRIYQARDILLRRFRKPPSLKELAHQVGLNDCTLKRQFKQVFGTTVFGYLYDYRMEQARRWLLDRQWSVTEIARRVGYKNLCAFSTAFRKKFGVSPRSLQRQGQATGDREG